MKRANKKTCMECGYCKKLYRRFWYRFSLADKKYYCLKMGEMTQLKNECENYEDKTLEYDISDERFEEIERDIKLIMKYTDGI